MRFCGTWTEHRTMNRNARLFVVGALVFATVVLGYQLYQEEHKTDGVETGIGERAISVERK